MRIIAGSLGGRTIQAPKTNATRPITDKIRAAIFDSLGDIAHQTVLDVYAGSGAMGFEALSRGAAKVDAIEASAKAASVINLNQKVFDLDWPYHLYRQTVESWMAHRPAEQELYHLIIADPPYDQLNPDILERLAGYLSPQGILVVSHSSRRELLTMEGLKLISSRKYGDSAISMYQLN